MGAVESVARALVLVLRPLWRRIASRACSADTPASACATSTATGVPLLSCRLAPRLGRSCGQPAARRRPDNNHPQVGVWTSSASTSAQAIAAGTAVRRQQLQFLVVAQCPHGQPGRGGEFGDPDLCYDCDSKASRNVRCKLVSRGRYLVAGAAG